MTRDALRSLLHAVVLLGLASCLASCDSSRSPSADAVAPAAPAAEAAPARRTNPYEGTLTAVRWPGEKHLANVRQLTFGGENAEAYWSADGKKLIFQSTRPPYRCDQIFVVDVESPGEPRLVSTGKGRTTCAYFFPDGERILYASTHVGGRECPPPPDMSQGYTWAIYSDYDIFSAKRDGSDLRRLTVAPGYDAEATISRDGKRIVFTSVRDGDLELYSMNADGGDVKRLTRTPGYDGGAFFSDDGEWIVYRASRPDSPKAVEAFKSLLDRSLVRPNRLEVHVMRSDGSGDRQVTNNGVASFAPYFFPGSHERLLYVSNLADPNGRDFDIFAVDVDGTDLERITYNPTFDGFPMFSPDGRRIAFCSNRHNGKPNETNVFVADWVP
jgi:Tol biopolymer transport system component